MLLKDKLSQLITELREEGFDVKFDDMKSVLKIEIEISKTEIAKVKVRKTAKNYDKLVNVLTSILLLSCSINKLFKLVQVLNLQIFQTTNKITIKHEFDVPKLKRPINTHYLSFSTENLREDALKKLSELDELAEIATIKYTYYYDYDYNIDTINFSQLVQALNELLRIKENYSEYRQAINTVVLVVSDYIKSANKLTQEDNSEYLKHKRQLRELEVRALEAGDYYNVSDETLKQWIKETFPEFRRKLYILDRSSKYRAVLFCTLELHPYFNKLVPAEYYLCGEDDNGEEWCHLIATNFIYCNLNTEILYKRSVKWAESQLLNVPTSLFDYFIDRQGDVFVFRDEDQANYREQEETDEFEILPNHILKLEKTAVIKYKRKSNKIYLDLPVPAVLEHPSHHHVKLQPAKYLFVHVVSNDQPVD